MTALRRLACGPFHEADSVTLEQLPQDEGDKPQALLPLVDALADWTPLTVDDAVRQRLEHGVAPPPEAVAGLDLADGERVKFLFRDELIALAARRRDKDGKEAGDFELLKVFPLEKER